MTYILGADPGASGALALYNPANNNVEVLRMPIHKVVRNGKSRAEIDGYALGSWVDVHSNRIKRAYIEQVGGLPGQGGQFQFGLNTGVLHGVLYANLIPVEFAPPATWKRALGLKRAAGQTKSDMKSAARRRAALLFPHLAAEFAKVKDDGVAEAVLIAFYGATKEL